MINKRIRWLKQKFKEHMLFSFKSTILSLYIPIIIVFILIIGIASYLLAAAQITDNAYRNIKNTVNQTGNYLDNRMADAFEQLVALSNHPAILTVAAKDADNVIPEDYLQVHYQIERIESFYSSLIESIYVDFYNGKLLLFRSADQSIRPRFSYEHYRQLYQGHPYDIYWRHLTVKGRSGRDTQDSGKQIISMFKLFGKNNARTSGIIAFNLKYEFFAKVLNSSEPSENGYLLLISPEEAMAFKKIDKKYELTADILQHLQTTLEKEGQLEYQEPNGEKMVVIYDTLPTSNWKLAAVFPQKDVLARLDYIQLITLSIIILLIFVAVFLANALASYIAKPLSLLTKSMKRIQGGNLNFTPQMHPLSEVGVLNQGLEDLVGRVKNLLEQIELEQENKRQLEFSVMQTQIHPHFLYNTLYSIKGLCDMRLNEEASAMVTALSNYFRISISRGQEIISVEEELAHIRNYLFIQEMRYGDDFAYEIEIDEAVLSYRIIKLTLQPLIENAIYHGVKQKRGSGRIVVRGYKTTDFICFEIRDNGLGMSKERLEEVRLSLEGKGTAQQPVGLGVRSTHERLRLHYGKKAGLKIESQHNLGTCVEVIIPL